MSRPNFNFKSSGIRTSNRKFVPKVTIKKTIGFKTPLQEGDDIFGMHTNTISQVADNFRNLIMTNHGERLGLHDYGGNLNSIVFEYSNSENFNEIILESIRSAVDKYMPIIRIVGVTSKKIDLDEKNNLNRVGLAKVTVVIEYVIPQLNSPKLGIEIDILAGG